MKAISKEDALWAAAWMDAEGTIGLYYSDGYCTTMLSSQTVREPLEKLQRILGGSLRLQKKSRKKNYRRCWRWELASREEVRAACRSLLPYLINKREQALVILGLPPVYHTGPGRRLPPSDACRLKEAFDSLAMLNARGYREDEQLPMAPPDPQASFLGALK